MLWIEYIVTFWLLWNEYTVELFTFFVWSVWSNLARSLINTPGKYKYKYESNIISNQYIFHTIILIFTNLWSLQYYWLRYNSYFELWWQFFQELLPVVMKLPCVYNAFHFKKVTPQVSSFPGALSLTLRTRGFTQQKYVCFLTFLKFQRLFHE